MIAILLALLLALGGPATAFAQTPTPTPTGDNGTLNPDNIVIAENTTDGSSLFKFGFAIIAVLDDTVDSANAAVALASCNSCRTVAIAISIVLIMGKATTVVPENLALAVNSKCNLCETMALAYQLVLTPTKKARLSKRDLIEINALLARIQRIGASDLPLAEIDAQVSALVDKLFGIVRDALAPDERDDNVEQHEEASPTPTPSPSATPTPTPTTAPSAEPSPTPTSESTTPSPEPSPTS
jgi:putative peptide zinc metalloprotease protein